MHSGIEKEFKNAIFNQNFFLKKSAIGAFFNAGKCSFFSKNNHNSHFCPILDQCDIFSFLTCSNEFIALPMIIVYSIFT